MKTDKGETDKEKAVAQLRISKEGRRHHSSVLKLKDLVVGGMIRIGELEVQKDSSDHYGLWVAIGIGVMFTVAALATIIQLLLG